LNGRWTKDTGEWAVGTLFETQPILTLTCLTKSPDILPFELLWDVCKSHLTSWSFQYTYTVYHIAANQEVGDGFSLDQANMDIECILNILKTILGAHKSQNRYYNAIDLVVEAQEGGMLTKHRRVPETFCKDKYVVYSLFDCPRFPVGFASETSSQAEFRELLLNSSLSRFPRIVWFLV
jgi:ribosome-associated translation inhibitor RaiA